MLLPRRLVSLSEEKTWSYSSPTFPSPMGVLAFYSLPTPL